MQLNAQYSRIQSQMLVARESIITLLVKVTPRKHIETTHCSSMVDKNVSSFSMSCLSLPSTDENVVCVTQNQQAYWTSRGIMRSKVSLGTKLSASRLSRFPLTVSYLRYQGSGEPVIIHELMCA